VAANCETKERIEFKYKIHFTNAGGLYRKEFSKDEQGMVCCINSFLLSTFYFLLSTFYFSFHFFFLALLFRTYLMVVCAN